MRLLPAIAVTAALALTAAAQDPATAPSAEKPAKTSTKKRVKKPVTKTVAKKSASTTTAKTAAKKPAARRAASPRTSVSAATRAEAHEGVVEKVFRGAQLPVENAAALVPFFEQLYRQQHGELTGPLRALHYGDSHVAADEWTGDIRERLQQTFGDGGSGYSLAGRPWNSYRRFDVKSGSTRGWHSDGLVGRTGDGIYGLGGVSMTAISPGQSVYILAEGQQFELYYLQQPGGGAIQIYDNGTPVERISTDGESAPSYFHYDAEPGAHRLEAETLDHAPVRLFGWVAEKPTGVTYEALGINGASASMMLDWNEVVLKSNIERRNPALIVLSYGTNEAGRKDWTLESYRDMFTRLIERLRNDAPTATILVVGPPDRAIRVRGKGWVTLDNVDMIVEAEREAALAHGCAFWDQRAKMGGKGSMREWVLAGMAQGDYVHLTAPGYHMIGDAMFRDLMSEYDLFVKAREALAVVPNLDRP
jgi:lysophospholipase L1-like esterase